MPRGRLRPRKDERPGGHRHARRHGTGRRCRRHERPRSNSPGLSCNMPAQLMTASMPVRCGSQSSGLVARARSMRMIFAGSNPAGEPLRDAMTISCPCPPRWAATAEPMRPLAPTMRMRTIFSLSRHFGRRRGPERTRVNRPAQPNAAAAQRFLTGGQAPLRPGLMTESGDLDACANPASASSRPRAPDFSPAHQGRG